MLEGVRGLGLGLIVIAPIYRIEMAHFGPLELVLAGTALEVVYFASEIPTGVVADVYSRRLSCIIAGFIMGGGWLLEGAIPQRGPILVSQGLLGLGWTFFSGAAEAWIAGEVGEERAARAIVRGQQSNLTFAILGGFVGAGLATYELNLPILIAGASHIYLAMFLIAAMPETGFVRGAAVGPLQTARTTFVSGARAVRKNRFLVLIVGSLFLMGGASEGIDRLWEAHLFTDFKLPSLGGLPRLYWFAIVGGVATALSVGAVGLSRRFVERESDRALATTAVLMTGLVAAGAAVFGLSSSVAVAIVAYWGIRVGRNVLDPALNVWTIRHAHPAVRATVLSITEQSHSIGEIAAGPTVGVVGRLASIPTALVTSAIVEALAVPMLAREAIRAPAEKPAEVIALTDLPLREQPGAEPLATDL